MNFKYKRTLPVSHIGEQLNVILALGVDKMRCKLESNGEEATIYWDDEVMKDEISKSYNIVDYPIHKSGGE